MTACSHGMPTPASCVDCMYEGNLELPPPPEPSKVIARMVARYESQCSGCNLPIGAGDPIKCVGATVDDAWWIHAWCDR